MQVAIYCRVSTDEQDATNQLPEVKQLCSHRGWTVARQYVETVSGTAKVKPELARLLADAHAGKFSAVVVWALDRLGRGGIAEIAGIVGKLDAAHVALVSVKEPWADTSGPVRDLLVAVMSWVAQQERSRLVERTKAGMARARADGKRLGRPPLDRAAMKTALALLAAGKRIEDVARVVGLGASTIRRELRAQAAL